LAVSGLPAAPQAHLAVPVVSLPLFTWCEICGAIPAIPTTDQNALNGLPDGVRACQGCRQAVMDRAVGVVIQSTGRLYVTDGRHLEECV
jgi:hypothetical protein